MQMGSMLIRDTRGAHAGLQLEHFAGEVRWRAKTSGGEIEPSRLLLENSNKLGH
jgi:hypothetical protein